MFVESEERWKEPKNSQDVLTQNWGGTKPNRTVTCIVLKATHNDRRTTSSLHDEFRWPSGWRHQKHQQHSLLIAILPFKWHQY
ncbi:hypothetical protein TNCV_4850931 [Trichonephila clavipes]|nr:hypothetical protein TNCV_4850931 [Trichonephila clavipes]